ncbi:MAG: IS1595 family transposase [Methanocalculaceae archaeon]|nr:IS1595 family transposase [Methanocalculaceae archaeon]
MFPTDEDAINHFICIRYPDGMACPHCGATKNVYRRKGKPKVFVCMNCKNTFSVFKGTIFEDSQTSMKMWFYAIDAMLNGKKGISSRQLQREISVTYKCAWRVLKLIRMAMGNEHDKELFEAIVEIDETYVGGRPKKGLDEDQKRRRGQRDNKDSSCRRERTFFGSCARCGYETR